MASAQPSTTVSHTTDPSTNWPAIRITSSSSIQSVVSTSLLHLSNPLSSPLILHTLPSPSNTSAASSIIPKNSHAGLCKLISIIEIIKRELEGYLKECWRVEDEKLRKKEEKRTLKSKGKKRAREEDDEGGEEVSMAIEGNDTSVAENVEQLEDDSTPAPKTTLLSKPTTKDKKRKLRPLLRVYQYNILDSYERLSGTSTSASASTSSRGAAASGSGNAEGSDDNDSDDDDDDSEDEDDEDEESKIESDLIKKKDDAKRKLDDAIQTHVVKARKRPRKKHTPYMKIILSTKLLPEYEHYLRSHGPSSSSSSRKNTDYTIQLPPKKSKSRGNQARKRKGKDKDAATDKDKDKDLEEGEVGDVVVEEGTGGEKGEDTIVAKNTIEQQTDTQAAQSGDMVAVHSEGVAIDDDSDMIAPAITAAEEGTNQVESTEHEAIIGEKPSS